MKVVCAVSGLLFYCFACLLLMKIKFTKKLADRISDNVVNRRSLFDSYYLISVLAEGNSSSSLQMGRKTR